MLNSPPEMSTYPLPFALALTLVVVSFAFALSFALTFALTHEVRLHLHLARHHRQSAKKKQQGGARRLHLDSIAKNLIAEIEVMFEIEHLKKF